MECGFFGLTVSFFRRVSMRQLSSKAPSQWFSIHEKYWSLLEGQTPGAPSAWSEMGQVKKPSGLVEAPWASEPLPKASSIALLYLAFLFFYNDSSYPKFFLPSWTSSSSLDHVFSSLNVMICTMGAGERAQHWECSLLQQRTGVSSPAPMSGRFTVLVTPVPGELMLSSGLYSNPHIHSHK